MNETEEQLRQDDAFEAGLEGAAEPLNCPPEEDGPAEEEIAAPQEEAPLAPLSAGQEDDLDRFSRLFPEAARDPDAIPGAVWEAVRSGADLTLAYALHQLQESRSAARSRENTARATGSMCSAGADRKPHDPFLEGWDD